MKQKIRNIIVGKNVEINVYSDSLKQFYRFSHFKEDIVRCGTPLSPALIYPNIVILSFIEKSMAKIKKIEGFTSDSLIVIVEYKGYKSDIHIPLTELFKKYR